MFQHYNVPVQKASFMKTGFAKVDVEEHVWSAQRPDLKPTEHLCDESKHWLHSRPPDPASVPDFTNALVAELAQILTVMFQNPVETGDQLNLNAQSFGMECSASTYRCDDQVSTSFWPYGVEQDVYFSVYKI